MQTSQNNMSCMSNTTVSCKIVVETIEKELSVAVIRLKDTTTSLKDAMETNQTCYYNIYNFFVGDGRFCDKYYSK